MSEKSIKELKEKLEKIEARKCKLQDEEHAIREVIKKKDDAFKPLREQHLEAGVTKILEELGWTKAEYIKALGGEIKESAKVETKGSSKTYVQLIPLNEGANCVPAKLIKMTPRLSKDAKAIIAEVGLIRLLKHTINLTTDEANKERAVAKLKVEEANAKYKVT